MANSRLEKLGTIFSRVTALLRTGALKREDKPIWYDVYQVFPPKTEPSYANRRPLPEIQEILYPEDSIRAKFHRKMYKRLPMDNLLQEPTNNLTRRAIDLTYNMMRKDQSLSEDQAINEVIEIFKREGVISTSRLSRSRRNRDIELVENRLENNGDEIGSRTHSSEYGVKRITDKSIDVSKFMKDD